MAVHTDPSRTKATVSAHAGPGHVSVGVDTGKAVRGVAAGTKHVLCGLLC